MPLHEVSDEETDAHHIRLYLICLRQVPLLRGQFNARRIDSALVQPKLFKRHLRRTLYLHALCNSQSKTIRFDDRLSLERARHELKKKYLHALCSRDILAR